MRLPIITAALLVGPFAGALMAQDTTQSQNPPRTQQDTTYQSQRGNQYGSDRPLSDEMVLMRVHRTNLMEIRLGQLAQTNGRSSRVKSYAQRIVRDHKAADQKVTTLAQRLGITLGRGFDSAGNRYGRDRGRWGTDSTEGRYDRDTTERGYGRRDTTASDSTNRGYNQRYDTAQGNQGSMYGRDSTGRDEMRDRALAMQRLKTLHGAAFDSAFANAMVDGHNKAISMLENAQTTVQNADLRSFITSTLPTLREHLRLALALPGASSNATTTSSQ